MKFDVRIPFTVKTKQGDLTLRPGQVVTLAEEKARKLIEDGKIQPLPYVDHNGTLVIPSNSPQRYCWWQKGLSIKNTLRELGTSDEIMKKYKSPYSDN